MNSRFFLILFSSVLTAQGFDFFYFVLQWPGSICNTKNGCCYPTTGKPPVDFGIHGIWPSYTNGGYPSWCDRSDRYNSSEIPDLINRMQMDWPTFSCPTKDDGTRFWAHEWVKHGTCSKSIFDQHSYFSHALDFKEDLDILESLASAGIHPNGGFYYPQIIENVIEGQTGFKAEIECNYDKWSNNQLYQIYICVDQSGDNIIDCPMNVNSKCLSSVAFPEFV